MQGVFALFFRIQRPLHNQHRRATRTFHHLITLPGVDVVIFAQLPWHVSGTLTHPPSLND